MQKKTLDARYIRIEGFRKQAVVSVHRFIHIVLQVWQVCEKQRWFVLANVLVFVVITNKVVGNIVLLRGRHSFLVSLNCHHRPRIYNYS
jgi:hypothetical protein